MDNNSKNFKALERMYHKVREITTLKDLLDSSVQLYSERPAFLIKKSKGGEYFPITYKQVGHDVNALGTKLLNMGLKDSKIAIIGENCYEWIISYYAVVNGTGVVVPLDKELSQEEIYYLIETAGCKAVFYTKNFEKYFEDYDIEYKIKMKTYGDRTDISQPLEVSDLTEIKKGVPVEWEELVASGEKLVAQNDRSFIDAEIDPYEMKILLFTSGTTEAAKGVMLSHNNIAVNVMDTCRIAYVTPEDRTLSILPIHHTFESTMGMSLVLYRGASIAFFEGLKYINKNLVEAKATILIGVPLIFESIYEKIWKQAEKSGKAGALRKAIKLNKTLKSIGIDISRKLFKSVHEKFGGKLRMVVTGAAAIDPNVLPTFINTISKACSNLQSHFISEYP
jgi:long-chain acyl-CoA synthetase